MLKKGQGLKKKMGCCTQIEPAVFFLPVTFLLIAIMLTKLQLKLKSCNYPATVKSLFLNTEIPCLIVARACDPGQSKANLFQTFQLAYVCTMYLLRCILFF